MKRAWMLWIIALITVAAPRLADAAQAKISGNTEACIECHESVTPGIVADWRSSRHSTITPAQGAKKPELERRISADIDKVPEALQNVAVGCYECHSRNADKHADNFDHFDYKINTVVSSADCSTCHAEEFDQYSGSKKAHAIGNLLDNPVYKMLLDSILAVKNLTDNALVPKEVSLHAKMEACLACHGTRMEVDGMQTIDSALGEIEVPKLIGWPNQGVGRQNPDGSLGACTSCHPRHSFSIKIARNAYTCSQCHLDPDVPAWNVWRESKHGNITQSIGDEWNWTAVPWKPGADFTAPTCATCHNSLLAGPDGEVIVERTHDFGSRLWVRLFGLVYAAPQPKSGDTTIIKNADGLPLPTTFTNEPASEYLIDEEEQAKRKATMSKVCTSCHSTQWTQNHWDRLDSAIEETNEMTLTATLVLLEGWKRGLATGLPDHSPFDEAFEKMWTRQWLFYANSTRYGTAMMGQDYAAFKNGWWSLSENLQKMHEMVQKAPPKK